MIDPATILCAALARAYGVHIRPAEMTRALAMEGLTLTGGAKRAVADHLAEVERLSRMTGAAHAL